MPAAASVWAERLKLAPLEEDDVCVLPSGFRSVTVISPIVLPVILTVTACEAEPLKVSVAQPINDKPGDKIQRFQFTFGTSF